MGRDFSTRLESLSCNDYIINHHLTLNPPTMETTKPIPKNEHEALQWLIPALDRPLDDMPQDEFRKAWLAIGYLYGGLNPDGTGDHGTEVSYEDNGPVPLDRTPLDRAVLCEKRMAGRACSFGG